MTDQGCDAGLVTVGDVREFFHAALHDALAGQHLRVREHTEQYVVNLLAMFLRSEALFEPGPEGRSQLRPLARLLAEAVETADAGLRYRLLQRLGDVALFISGVFPDSLGRKLVDVDYYIAMGGTAYSYLSEVAEQSERWHALGEIFDELAVKFSLFVGVLGEVTEQAHFAQNRDLLRLYETWLRTGSSRLFQRLQALGIHPVRAGSGQVRN